MFEHEMHGQQPSERPSAPHNTPRSDPKLRAGAADGGGRVHLVMVPGFGGFDALGQLRYYPRTTAAAEAWRAEPPQPEEAATRDRLVLHYFDNLPTAGVNTRAHFLLRYLLDRQARNDFREGDVIALIGHSTGGLDIRRLLQMLLHVHPEDGASMSPAERKRVHGAVADKLRSKIKRVVFMSVPQRGTNIANWVRRMEPWPMVLVGLARRYFDALNLGLIERLETAFMRKLARPVRLRITDSRLERRIPDVYSALLDVCADNALRVSEDPVEAADGREALAQISLFLNQSDGDFLAIEDLAAQTPKPLRLAWRMGSRVRRIAARDKTDVARAGEKARTAELEAWKKCGIQTLSFATFATPGVCARLQRDESKLRTWSALLGWIPRPFGKSDGTFRFVYRACEWGPFDKIARPGPKSNEPDHSGEGKLFAGARDAEHYTRFRDEMPSSFIRSWENDGIVNTASMLWPDGPETRLVHGDHADIIGHFETVEAAPPRSGRKYEAYDIFGSNSGFDEARFNQIWWDIFGFCLNALTAVEPVDAVA